MIPGGVMHEERFHKLTSAQFTKHAHDNPMKVSIVIPAYNEEKSIPALMRSISAQDFPCEVIVADAQSTDATAMIARAHGCKVVPAQKGTPGMARNAGARAASGDIFVFLDADTMLPRNFLRRIIPEFMKRRLEVAACYASTRSGNPVDWVIIGCINSYYLLLQKIWPQAMGVCMLAARRAHEGIGGFDERITFSEDCDYANRAFKRGFKYGVLRSARVPTSMRRFDRIGRWKMIPYYLYLVGRRALLGEIRSEIDYEYGI